MVALELLRMEDSVSAVLRMAINISSHGELGLDLNASIDANTLENITTVDVEQLLTLILGARRKDLYSVGALTFTYCLLFLTGVTGNISTCIVIARNSYMHTVTNYYLFSLAVSDVLTLIFGEWMHEKIILMSL